MNYKQLHQEATTVLYGKNVFKYRSDHQVGRLDPNFFLVLPEKYLGLLRRIKVSVISGEANKGQDKWVADLLKNTFRKGKTRLEMFELTWYGWKKFRLTANGVLCQALLTLDVEKVFTVYIMGDARMETAMVKELTAKVGARRVQIKRPIFEVLKRDKVVEISDEE